MATYRKAASRLNKDLHAVVRDTEALVEATGDLAGEQIADIRSRASRSMKAVREALAEAPGEIAEQLHEAGEAAEKLIRRKPLPAMGLAVGFGLLIGLLVMTRSR